MFDAASEHPIASLLLSPAATFSAAIVAAIAALWCNVRVNKNARDLQAYKSDTDRDLERLKTKLAHGQLINETQWNAEFTSYQAIWKAMVGVRNVSNKLLMRETELRNLGLSESYLNSPASREKRIEIKRALLERATEALQALLLATHDNAPFYPTPIRTAANETHRAAKELSDKHLSAFPALEKGANYTIDPAFVQESEALWKRIVEGVDLTEVLIRDRLAEVQVVYGTSV